MGVCVWGVESTLCVYTHRCVDYTVCIHKHTQVCIVYTVHTQTHTHRCVRVCRVYTIDYIGDITIQASPIHTIVTVV